MRIGEYDVLWREAGWSWAVPTIRRRVRTLGFLWWRWKDVGFRGEARLRVFAETMHPDQMRRWFQGAVAEFEAYERAWAAETANPPASEGKP